MTNPLALASVSRLLKAMLQAMARQQNLAVTVSALPPRPAPGPAESAELSIHLYRVSQGPRDQTAGRPNPGGRIQGPKLALDLHYLVSARSSREYEAEVLLGHAMAALHETPMIANSLIQALLPDDPAQLASQSEIIRIVPQDLSLEEMSELWRALGTEMRPAAAYQVSTVLIEPAAHPLRRRADIPGLPDEPPAVISGRGAESALRRRSDDIGAGSVSSRHLAETEKSLGRVFGQAERSGTVLRSDDGEDLFRRRGED